MWKDKPLEEKADLFNRELRLELMDGRDGLTDGFDDLKGLFQP